MNTAKSSIVSPIWEDQVPPQTSRPPLEKIDDRSSRVQAPAIAPAAGFQTLRLPFSRK